MSARVSKTYHIMALCPKQPLGWNNGQEDEMVLAYKYSSRSAFGKHHTCSLRRLQKQRNGRKCPFLLFDQNLHDKNT